MDVFLQPHSDDICFSLGGLAHKLRRGILLTVFPLSAHVPWRAEAAPPVADEVTRTRIAEDRAFADACGLDLRMLPFPCAMLRGDQPFDLRGMDETLQRIEAPLLEVLLAMAADETSSARPWLFCPSGIGGHVDHVAIRTALIRNYPRLAPLYRIGFYEELYYASHPGVRAAGLQSLLQEMRGRVLHRHVVLLGDDTPRKLALIHHYRSQFLYLPPSIEGFTPAAQAPSAPHEAIWSETTMLPGRVAGPR